MSKSKKGDKKRVLDLSNLEQDDQSTEEQSTGSSSPESLSQKSVAPQSKKARTLSSDNTLSSPSSSGRQRSGSVSDVRLTAEQKALATRIRSSAAREDLIMIDASEFHLDEEIERWWQDQEISDGRATAIEHDFRARNSQLMEGCEALIAKNFPEEHRWLFDKIAEHRGERDKVVAATCITNLFHTPDERLARIVHEALSDLFYLKDIKYPYENHKALYIKPEGLNVRAWGNGKGDITPHSDDLYEETATTLLSLTVAKDETKTPTLFYQTKHILEGLDDAEIIRLRGMKAKFISGKNVEGVVKANYRQVLGYDEAKDDVTMAMDFRVDDKVGARMMLEGRMCLRSDSAIMTKIQDNLGNIDPIHSVPVTGTFLIVANMKGLHARQEIEINEEQIARVLTGNIENAVRLLYRSKGPKIDHQSVNDNSNDRTTSSSSGVQVQGANNNSNNRNDLVVEDLDDNASVATQEDIEVFLRKKSSPAAHKPNDLVWTPSNARFVSKTPSPSTKSEDVTHLTSSSKVGGKQSSSSNTDKGGGGRG